MNDKPWLNEPNFVKWIDPTTGLRCCIVRNNVGALCGYVRVPLGKLRDAIVRKSRSRALNAQPRSGNRGIGYDLHDLWEVDVHGGLTFCGKPHHHKVQRGPWLGFDCAHYGDLSPKILPCFEDGVYRDVAYVRGQCSLLALQVFIAANARAHK